MSDVANLADLDRLDKTVADEKGAVDIVVTNAGFVEHAPLATATPEHFDKAFKHQCSRRILHRAEALSLLANATSGVSPRTDPVRLPLFIET
jgi:NADP-dependent 3-hydroxy acid dehydrogenase YdfG